jgi:DNA-binding NtrC family response regulator
MNKKVLIVDDDEHIRSLFSMALRDSGCLVESAENGKKGLKKFRDFSPHVVILDIVMPEQEGVETMRALRKIDPTLPVIAVSGGSRIQAQKYLTIMEALGANHTFKKPVPLDQLIEAVRDL